MRVAKKIIFYVALTVVVLISVLGVTVWFNKDRIINRFVTEMNEHLQTPVNVGKISVTIFASFPNISIVLDNVYIEDSHKEKQPLLTASTITFSINPFEIWNEAYIIRGLTVINGEAWLRLDENGVNNYTIVKKASTSEQKLGFELRNVRLKNTRVHYEDLKVAQQMYFTSDALSATITSSNDRYIIGAKGDVTTDEISLGNTTYVANKVATVQTNLIYDDEEKLLTIEPSLLTVFDSEFSVSGSYGWREKKVIDITVKGENTTVQTLLAILPADVNSNLQKYRSRGNVFFDMNIRGPVGSDGSPSLTSAFGFDNATIFYPESNASLERVTLDGSFAMARVNDGSTAALMLNGFKGTLNGEPFEAALRITDFKDAAVQCAIKGTFDIQSVLNFYPVKQLNKASGQLVADVSFDGKIGWLKSKSTAQKAVTSGSVQMNNLSFVYGERNIPFTGLNGTLQFTNNDLALSNVSGNLGESDFVLNGFFKNIISFLLFTDQPVGIETDLSARRINLDELFAYGFSSGESTDDPYAFSISNLVNMNFNYTIGNLNYRRFHASALKGNLLIKDKVAVSRGMDMKTMGGALSVTGIIDAKNENAIDVVSTLTLKGLHIDSIFYVFENFNQSFIKDTHLRGTANATIDLELTLNKELKLVPETLVADIGVTIKQGELNNFEPLQKLDRYLDDEGLNHLRFADLHNEIHIENKTVYIPEMEVRSNVTAIRITGTHTFDQHINYRVVAPLRNKRKINLTEASNALEEDQAGRLKLFLKITGTADNYRIVYDTEAVKEKIVNDIKKEVTELKEAFRNKGEEKKKALELTEEEFDW